LEKNGKIWEKFGKNLGKIWKKFGKNLKHDKQRVIVDYTALHCQVKKDVNSAENIVDEHPNSSI
jgi:ElaB/YqjD/DUF883 family membrane-anchored ribosome-binding protein